MDENIKRFLNSRNKWSFLAIGLTYVRKEKTEVFRLIALRVKLTLIALVSIVLYAVYVQNILLHHFF